MRTQNSHRNSPHRLLAQESNHNESTFNKSRLYSDFDIPSDHNLSIAYDDHNKNVRKQSKYDILKAANMISAIEENRIAPIKPYIRTGSYKDNLFDASLKRSSRLKTDEFEKPSHLESSVNYPYIEKSKYINSSKQQFALPAQNSRGYGRGRASSNNPPDKKCVNLMKNIDESIMEAKRKRFNSNLKERRVLIHPEKNSNTSCTEPNLPVINHNSDADRHYREKSFNSKVSNIAGKSNDLPLRNTSNLLEKSLKKERFINKNQYLAKIPEVKDESTRNSKQKSKKESVFVSQNNPEIFNAERFPPGKLEDSPKTKSIAMFNDDTLCENSQTNSPGKKRRKRPSEGQNIQEDTKLFEAVQSSLIPLSKIDNTYSIDSAFEKVHELTNRNNVARFDLLKIQESALDLKMHLTGKKNKSQRNPKERSKPNQTLVEDIRSVDGLYSAAS